MLEWRKKFCLRRISASCPCSRPTDRLGSGPKSPHRRAGYRSDSPRAAGTTSPARSRCSGITATIELGEGDHPAKRRGQGAFRDPQRSCRHPGEALPILTRIKHSGMCSMMPNWPIFKEGTRSARAFWNDTSGVILPYVTVMLVVIVGLSVLALDGARLMSLQTRLQNGADALALAGAAELDRLPDAETRAHGAIENLLTNSLFGSGTNRTIAVSKIQFYSRLPTSDASPMSAGTLATRPANARFVSVTVRPVTLPTILPAAFFGGANTITTSASAVAGFDQVVCGVTPLYVCNPYETLAMSYDQATEALQRAAASPADQGRLIRLRQYDGNAPYAGADYGFLTSPTLGSDDASLIDSVAVVRPAACFLQRGVNFRPGVVQSVREGFNVRFDIYEGSMSDKYNDSNYQPAQNVRKGYVVASGDANQNACATRRGAYWPIGSPPQQVTGLPLDRTWPYFGRMGEGNWDFDTYWQV